MQVVSQDLVAQAIEQAQRNYSCTDFHQGLSCNQKALAQMSASVHSCFRMYFMVHFIPFLLFKRKKLKRNPTKEIMKLLVGLAKSLLFAGGYTAIVRRVVCLITQNHKFVGYSNLLAAIAAGITLNFEPISRQSEIALFCLNKSTEVCYQMARRRNWPVRVPHGEGLLMVVSLAVVAFHYMNNREAIRQSYLKVLDKLLGDC